MQRAVRAAVPMTGRGSLPGASPAWAPPPTRSVAEAFGGAVTRARIVALRSAYYQPVPQAVPPGPLPREAQGSWAHGPTMGGSVFVQLPPIGGPLFYLKQRTELPVPITTVGGPGSRGSMTTAKPATKGTTGRFQPPAGYRRWAWAPTGRWVTASPDVVPRWPIIGTGGRG